MDGRNSRPPQFRNTTERRQGLARSEKALLRSQSGPLAFVPFTSMPVNRVSRVDSQPFRDLLLRRLCLPLPISVRSCLCGCPLDVFGHHRAACATAGVLGRRGFAVESAVAQICREGGARVSTNVMVRDLDISQSNSTDSRRLEVIAEGLSLFGGGTVGSRCHLGLCVAQGWHREEENRHDKRRGTPRGPRAQRGRARLVVIAGEVGGRWSQETKAFLWSLASDKANSAPKLLRGSASSAEVDQLACVLSSKGFRDVSAGAELFPRRRWQTSLRAGGLV